MPSIVVVQARTNSNRLPQKTIKKINGKPLIYYLLKRLLLTKLKIILAVPIEDEFVFRKILQDFPAVSLLVGASHNVLERYYQASQKFPCSNIIRVTADNPFTSIYCLLTILNQHIGGNYDYSFFSKLPFGAGVEVVKKEVLQGVYQQATSLEDLEHVTLFMRKNSPKYRVLNALAPLAYRYPQVRVTVDTLEDFIRTEKIIASYFNEIVPLKYIIKNYASFKDLAH